MRIAHRLIAVAVCFCASFLVSAPLFAFSEWYVNTTADSGPGSLRAAILNANANDNGNLIYFVFPGPGITTISPTSPLPVIIGGNQGVEIRGVNLAGTPGVELSGTQGSRTAGTA